MAKLPRAVFANGAHAAKSQLEKELRDGYRTPGTLIDAIEHAYGSLTLDVAASAENRVRPVPFFSKQDSALDKAWGAADGFSDSFWWANPPFSLTAKFITKGLAEVFYPTSGPTLRGAFLVNACTETKWWHELMGSLTTGKQCSVVRFLTAEGPLRGYADLVTQVRGKRLRSLTVHMLEKRVNFSNPELYEFQCEEAKREGREPPRSDTGPAPKGSIVAFLENGERP